MDNDLGKVFTKVAKAFGVYKNPSSSSPQVLRVDERTLYTLKTTFGDDIPTATLKLATLSLIEERCPISYDSYIEYIKDVANPNSKVGVGDGLIRLLRLTY